MRGLNGKSVYSEEFNVRRGVIQGDIISPIFFVLALEQIFRDNDNSGDGVQIGNHLRIGVLGYADDEALISESTTRMSDRVTSISSGSKKDGDMDINKKKTKVMHVARQEKIRPSTDVEINETEKSYKHVCDFCPRRFKTSRGLKIHRASCKCQHGLTTEEFEIDSINATFGTVEQRWYRVCWKGHEGKDSWEPERSLVQQGCEESIRTFWLRSKHSPCL